MAGFVDGEGTISINKQIRKHRPSPAYRAYVSVSNTDKNVLRIFAKNYGGNTYRNREHRKDQLGRNWSDLYRWQCPVSQTKRLLLDIQPYLRLRKNKLGSCSNSLITRMLSRAGKGNGEEDLLH
jgi:hypothetical protein